MKKSIYLFGALFLSLLLIGSGCTKYSFMKMEDKVIGTWTFEKATLRPGTFKPPMDVTKNFKNLEFTFNSDGTSIVYNNHTKETKNGYWKMYAIEEYDEENSSYQYILKFQYNLPDRKKETYVWDIENITAKRFRAHETIGNDNYNYVLLRK
ncbi:MAG TPA: DUF5004 domain-containing protein [Edaphocola sp.]|nr:DUF5004 domain-containing protein [Edaphocola sp.]